MHDEIHVTSHYFNNDLQQDCQVSCDQNRDEDTISNFPSCRSSANFFSHEKVYENQILEITCIKSLGSEIIPRDRYPELHEKYEE